MLVVGILFKLQYCYYIFPSHSSLVIHGRQSRWTDEHARANACLHIIQCHMIRCMCLTMCELVHAFCTLSGNARLSILILLKNLTMPKIPNDANGIRFHYRGLHRCERFDWFLSFFISLNKEQGKEIYAWMQRPVNIWQIWKYIGYSLKHAGAYLISMHKILHAKQT